MDNTPDSAAVVEEKPSKENKVKKAAKEVKPIRKPKAKLLWRSSSQKKNRHGKTKPQLDSRKKTSAAE